MARLAFPQLLTICMLLLSNSAQAVQLEPPLNPFEPLGKRELLTDQDGNAGQEVPTAVDQAAEQPKRDEENRAAAPELPKAAELENDPATLFTQPVPVDPREDLLRGAFKKPYVIEIDAPIDHFFEWYITKSLELAQKNGADVVVIKLTTPGGVLDTSLNLAKLLNEIEWAKTVVWIPEEAYSGGAIMSLGADAVYMKKSAMFGDAGPIYLTFWGDAIDAEEKVASAAVTAIRQVASDSGRPIEVAAAMADRKLKIYSATERNTGLTAFLTDKQIQNPVNAARFEIGEAVPESGDDRFLTVSGLRAKQLMLCDETFESESNMLQSLSGVEPGRIKVTTTDHWVYVLNRPWLTTLILIVGIICLYFEMTAPGATLPGLVSLLCFGLFFWSHVLGGTVTGLEIMLFLLGTLALFIEIFVLPGFGVFGISGMIMVALALLMATQDFVIPDNPQQWKQLEGNGLSILLACIVVAIIIVVQVFWLDSIPGLSRLQLRPEEMPVVAAATSLHPAAHLQLGVRGICQSDLRPSGKILVEGQLIDVLSEGEYVEAGQAVSVIRIEGNCITVRKVTG